MIREDFAVARWPLERLMREVSLAGVIRGNPVRTTISDKAAPYTRDCKLKGRFRLETVVATQ